MAEQVSPTKGNLLNVKKARSLAILGYELLDRKRNILIREMMLLIEGAKIVRDSIEKTYKEAYLALQNANITLGIITNFVESVPIDNGLEIKYRSVMGIEIPILELKKRELVINYGFMQTNSLLDKAYLSFDIAKRETVLLAEIENSICRLANGIKKTQRRANALNNIIIPRFNDSVNYISNYLEEKEREEFSRLKVIKAQKLKGKIKAKKD